MITLLFLIMMLGIVGKLIGFAFRMSWGLLKILFIIAFWPLILIGMVMAGLIGIAFPILIIIGIISLFTTGTKTML